MLKPLFDNVVLEKIKSENKTASGIVLSEKKEDPAIAVVVAVGPGRIIDGKLAEMKVKVGDKVVFKKYGATDVKVEDKEYAIIAQDDILAVIE